MEAGTIEAGSNLCTMVRLAERTAGGASTRNGHAPLPRGVVEAATSTVGGDPHTSRSSHVDVRVYPQPSATTSHPPHPTLSDNPPPTVDIPPQMTALMGDAVGAVGAAMPSAAAGPGGGDTAAVMSAGAAQQGRDTIQAMAANPLVMPNGAAVTGQMSTTAAGMPAITTQLTTMPGGAPGTTVSVDAAALAQVMASNEDNKKPLGRGQTVETRAQGDAIQAMKEASGMYGPPPSTLSKWMNLGGGRGAGRKMLAV